MACSKYEYVKAFEQPYSTLLRNTWIVVRLDGHSFHRFTSTHAYRKPNDSRGLALMSAAAKAVMAEYQDVCLAYGQSDEFSFILPPTTSLWGRRREKIITTLCSSFTANFVMKWSEYFDDQCPLQYAPSFDARAICYPTLTNLRDYLSWRQVDCHINNLYNTAFWALVLGSADQPPMTERQAEAILKDTDSAAKNELLFIKFGINYNTLDPMFRKGSVIYRSSSDMAEIGRNGEAITRKRKVLTIVHEDIIGDSFFIQNGVLDEWWPRKNVSSHLDADDSPT